MIIRLGLTNRISRYKVLFDLVFLHMDLEKQKRPSCTIIEREFSGNLESEIINSILQSIVN